MSQTRNSSYKKLFSLWESSEDAFEKEVLGRILFDYVKNHHNEFKEYDKLLEQYREPECPRCHSDSFIKYGLSKNGTPRYQCKECGKTFKGLHQIVWTQRKMPPNSVDQLHQTLWIK